jgi:hypothetical protein
MSIYQIREEATANKDMDTFATTIHDDFEFISHQDGTTWNRE